MTPDSWERRPLPTVLGWNNPASPPPFTVVYNQGPDTLTITASQPIFGNVDTVNFTGSSATGQLNVGVNFNVDSPTQITVPSPAGFVLSSPNTLVQLDFFAPSSTLVGTWVGSVLVATGVTFVVTYDGALDRILVTASQPIFVPTTVINIQGDAGTFILAVGVHFDVDSPTTLHIDTGTAYGPLVTQLDFFAGITMQGVWIGSVLAGLALIAADSTAMNRLEISGTGLLIADNARVIDNFAFDTRYYDENGPNAGLNPPGSTVVWTDTLITITDPALATLTITLVQARDLSDAFIAEFFPNVPIDGPALTYPDVFDICSPNANEIRFQGVRFLSATVGPIGYVIPRLLDYSNSPPNVLEGPGMIYNLADGSPDLNGWSLVSHTDTEIVISNPAFTAVEPSAGPGDFIATGVAFHSVDAIAMYYYEPWGEPFFAIVDGVGC